MAENEKYFTKTAQALKNIHQSIIDLDTIATTEQISKKELSKELSNIKQEIREKAIHIDSIIETLNEAIN